MHGSPSDPLLFEFFPCKSVIFTANALQCYLSAFNQWKAHVHPCLFTVAQKGHCSLSTSTFHIINFNLSHYLLLSWIFLIINLAISHFKLSFLYYRVSNQSSADSNNRILFLVLRKSYWFDYVQQLYYNS